MFKEGALSLGTREDKKRSKKFEALKEQYDTTYRFLVKGLQEMEPKKSIYPDANFSMRLSYGQVYPLPTNLKNDAKINYYTTLNGTQLSNKPGDEEFDLPPDLIELYKRQDYGPYADKEGFTGKLSYKITILPEVTPARPFLTPRESSSAWHLMKTGKL
nr:S46 family peptidase [Bacteroidetes bacterium endosymbiont of Geopemphigus sp.]